MWDKDCDAMWPFFVIQGVGCVMFVLDIASRHSPAWHFALAGLHGATAIIVPFTFGGGPWYRGSFTLIYTLLAALQTVLALGVVK